MPFPYELIDLTHVLESTIPTWNGACGFNQDVRVDYDDCEGDTKFRVMTLRSNAGIGTHMDAPSHCFKGGLFVHDFELKDLCMPCVVIDVSAKADARYSLTIEDVMAFESAHDIIARGSCVMVRTGWEKWWCEPEKYRNDLVFPSVSVEAARFLAERGVTALGIDTLSSDRPEDGFKVHQIFLGSGKILIENVTNLQKMPSMGSFVMCLPLNIKGGTEAPVRLVGLKPKHDF